MSSKFHPKLFTPINIGPTALTHRIVMAPLTRQRAETPGDIPGDLVVKYYDQRASEGGLIITEATTISMTARGYLGAPGIYSQQQVAGWRRVTDVVHAKGGRIFLQLWHVGRTSHVDMTGGAIPIGPSLVPYEGKAFTADGWVATTPNRALTLEEIPALLNDYKVAAENAKAAGFDGVEVHGGNGYLIDQFIQDGSNQRTDAYGGSPENRARLLLEVLDTIVPVWGADRVGVRLSPSTSFNGMSDSNPEATFGYIAAALNPYGLAWLHVIEPRIAGNTLTAEGLGPVAAGQMRKIFKGVILAAGGFEPDTAEEILEKGDADMVVFGRHFIANPDLPRRIRLGLSLHAYDRETFYGGNAHGYTDYPTYEEEFAAAAPQTSVTDRNKAIVLEAFDTLFNKRDYAAAERFWSPAYIQHSAHIEDGRDGLFNLIRSIPPTLRYEPSVIVAEGDLVILHGRFSGTGLPANWIAADIVRLKDGILVEHWDVIQDEATEEQSKSKNPMFGSTFPTAHELAFAAQ